MAKVRWDVLPGAVILIATWIGYYATDMSLLSALGTSAVAIVITVIVLFSRADGPQAPRDGRKSG